jgi:hypothetical protein
MMDDVQYIYIVNIIIYEIKAAVYSCRRKRVEMKSIFNS